MRNIAPMLNVTRTWNAVAAAAGMRRGLALARDYARRRVVFGAPLSEKVLHLETLADIQCEQEAAFHLAFRAVELLGREEAGELAPREGVLLRLITPLAKLATARQAVAGASEILESFGGAGYIEDTGLPRLLRDAQVLPIWEGTTNVLSLDVLRALEKTNALAAYATFARARLAAVTGSGSLHAAAVRLRDAVDSIESFADRLGRERRDFGEAHARAFAYAIARTTIGLLLLEYAIWTLSADGDRDAVLAATQWCERPLTAWDNEEGPVPSPMIIG